MPVLGVWSSGRGVVELVEGVALVAGGLSGVPVVLLGVATLEFDWLLVDDWSGGLLVVAEPATPPVEDGVEVELCEPMLELELGEEMLLEEPAALWSAAAPLTPEPSEAEPGLELEQVDAMSFTLVTVKFFPALADD